MTRPATPLVASPPPSSLAVSSAPATTTNAPRFWRAGGDARWTTRILLLPLALLAALFGLVVRVRRWWYARPGRARRVAAPVISVGNLTVGGAGKTPVAIEVSQRLLRAGRRPVVLSRGYGRRASESDGGADANGFVVVSDGARVLADAESAGDEPLLIARRCPGVPVMVGADRAALAEEAVRLFGPGCTLVLDDGFQHLRLHRDADIVVVDASDPFGNGHLLPRGPLREPIATLRRAALVWLSKVDQAASPEAVEALAARVAALCGGREAVRAGYRISDIVDLPTGRSLGVDALAGVRVVALVGLARPESFLATLRASGAEVVGVCAHPDHHAFTDADVDAARRRAHELGAAAIAVTEKDAVRLPAAAATVADDGQGAAFRVVRVEVAIDRGEAALDALLSRVAGVSR